MNNRCWGCGHDAASVCLRPHPDLDMEAARKRGHIGFWRTLEISVRGEPHALPGVLTLEQCGHCGRSFAVTAAESRYRHSRARGPDLYCSPRCSAHMSYLAIKPKVRTP